MSTGRAKKGQSADLAYTTPRPRCCRLIFQIWGSEEGG
jgi:hypothetical protein